MTPPDFDLAPWLPLAGLVVGGGGVAGLLGVWLVHIASQRRNTDAARRERAQTLAEWRDDTSDLSKYIRDEVAKQVEAEMKPIRAKMQRLESESHEMNDAVRARETQLWLWDQRGRPGALPMLPAPILERLGLAHLASPKETP